MIYNHSIVTRIANENSDNETIANYMGHIFIGHEHEGKTSIMQIISFPYNLFATAQICRYYPEICTQTAEKMAGEYFSREKMDKK